MIIGLIVVAFIGLGLYFVFYARKPDDYTQVEQGSEQSINPAKPSKGDQYYGSFAVNNTETDESKL